MALKTRIVSSVVRQFGHPQGMVGRLVGWSMGRRSSNVQRSRWAVDLLDLQPSDRLLEVGCGPGVAVAAAARRAATVVGVDRSAVMVGQARRRNRRAVRNRRVEVHLAAVEDLPTFDAPFDKALAVNTVGHWDDPVAGLVAVRQALRPDATIAVVSQPRCAGATAVHSREAAAELEALLDQAGFGPARIETLDLDPPVVCLLATAERGEFAGSRGD
jgi:cyclopropane fatty-acyl-phospholipid synthase-like methyltransferase